MTSLKTLKKPRNGRLPLSREMAEFMLGVSHLCSRTASEQALYDAVHIMMSDFKYMESFVCQRKR